MSFSILHMDFTNRDLPTDHLNAENDIGHLVTSMGMII